MALRAPGRRVAVKGVYPRHFSPGNCPAARLWSKRAKLWRRARKVQTSTRRQVGLHFPFFTSRKFSAVLLNASLCARAFAGVQAGENGGRSEPGLQVR